MVELEEVKKYILENKNNYARDKINVQLQRTNVSLDMIQRAWDEIDGKAGSDGAVKSEFFTGEEEPVKKMPVSDMISWVVIVVIIIWGIYYFLF